MSTRHPRHSLPRSLHFTAFTVMVALAAGPAHALDTQREDVAAFVAGVAIFCHSYFTAVPADRKDALRPILAGLLLLLPGLLLLARTAVAAKPAPAGNGATPPEKKTLTPVA